MFPEMYKIIPEGKLGIAEIKHQTPSKHDCKMSSLRGLHLEERTMAILHVNSRLMISDGPEEHYSNYEVVWKAKGSVLIAGLGIGMVLTEILKKKEG